MYIYGPCNTPPGILLLYHMLQRYYCGQSGSPKMNPPNGTLVIPYGMIYSVEEMRDPSLLNCNEPCWTALV